MNQIKDELDMLLAQIASTYFKGIQQYPQYSGPITRELLAMKSVIESLVEESNHPFPNPILDTGMSLHNPGSDTLINHQFTGQTSPLTEIPFPIEDYIQPEMLAFDQVSNTTEGAGNVSATTVPHSHLAGLLDTICPYCFQSLSFVGTNRKRRHRQIDINDKYTLAESSSPRDKLVAALKLPNLTHPTIEYKIYQGVGSRRVLLQLRTILCNLRLPEGSQCHWRAPQISGTVRALDQIGELHCTSGFLRRVLLLRLLHQKNLQLQILKDQSPKLHGKKVETLVLDEMMGTAYMATVGRPADHEKEQWRRKYDKQRKSLQNYLGKATHWQLAVDVVGLGILALFPTDTDDKVKNYRFEGLRRDHCQAILDELRIKDDGGLRTAATNLTPFVQAIYDGREYQERLKIETFEEKEIMEADIKTLLGSCRELAADSMI